MIITIDASVAMAVILNEPIKGRLVELTVGTELISAPTLPWEVGNALSALLRRRRLEPDAAEAALASYLGIRVRLPEVKLGPCVALASRYDIYAYDAYVVECARRYRTALLSLDRRQCEVAREEGVETLEVAA